jgi:hypothetical protein
MKSLMLLVIGSAIVLLPSCFLDNLNVICSDATGDVVTKTFTLDSMVGINLSESANVFISQGETQEVTIEGKEDAIAKLKTEVHNGIWYIEFDECVVNHDLEIRITLPLLTTVKVSGSGDVFGETAFQSGDNAVSIDVSGSGYVNLDMTATNMNTRISGSGDVRCAGAATNHEVKISGSGSLKAFDLKSQNYDITISGSGNSEVFVDGGSLAATISGSGKVKYKGSPSSFNVNISGSGKVIDEN